MSINHNLWRERSGEASFRLPAERLTTRPSRLTMGMQCVNDLLYSAALISSIFKRKEMLVMVLTEWREKRLDFWFDFNLIVLTFLWMLNMCHKFSHWIVCLTHISTMTAGFTWMPMALFMISHIAVWLWLCWFSLSADKKNPWGWFPAADSRTWWL